MFGDDGSERHGLVKIYVDGDPGPSDAELFDRLHTVAFSFGEMNRAISFDRARGKLDLEAWHDHAVPGCYRARVAEIALATLQRFYGKPYSDELREAFIHALREAFIHALRVDVYNHLEPIAPAITFHRTHDEWPS